MGRFVSTESVKEISNEKGVSVRKYIEIEDDLDPHHGGVFKYERAAMVTPSGHEIHLGKTLLDDYYNKGATVNLDEKEIKDKIKYARSIYDNPAQILKIDKKMKKMSADTLKAYVDIAKAGLEASLEKAGEEFSRGSNNFSSKARDKASSKYRKTLDLIEDLSKKITEKFQQIKENLDQEKAGTLKNRKVAVQSSINAILDEPQRGQ